MTSTAVMSALALTFNFALAVVPAISGAANSHIAEQDIGSLPPLDRRASADPSGKQSFEDFALAVSGYWLTENAAWYLFASYDPATQTLRWENSSPGHPHGAQVFMTVRYDERSGRLRGAEYNFVVRARPDFQLTESTTLRSHLRSFGLSRHVGLRLLERDQLALYGGPDGKLEWLLHRVPPGDPDGRLARAWAPGAIRWSQAMEAVNAAERAREEASSAGVAGLLDTLVRGAAMGVSGVGAPLMNADGSAVNTLDVLNAANAELARQNETLAARGDAIIASRAGGGQSQQAAPNSPMPRAAGGSSTSQVGTTQAGAGSPPVSRYGWCYAHSSGGDQGITYVSRVGRTERLLANGAMLGGSSSDWHTTVAREWSQQINAPHTAATCTARDTADFEALRRAWTSGQQVVEIPWSPR